MHDIVRLTVVLLVTLTAVSAVAGGVAVADTTETTSIECEFPLEITDATGETVTVEEEPEEIVVLGASGSQYAWYMDAEEKVIGAPDFHATAYIENIGDRTNVVDEQGAPVTERIVDLDPDLVYAPSIISEDDITELRDAGLTVYAEHSKSSIDDIYDALERFGQLTGECEAASQTVTDMQTAFDAIDDALEEEDPVSVFYFMDPEFGWTAGAGTVEDELITKAGGENIAAEEIDFYAEYSEELIVDKDPEWIVIGEGRDVPSEGEPTTAVQEDQIVEVDQNFISQHGPVSTEPLIAMAEAFHTEAFEDVDREAISLIDDETFASQDVDDETGDTDDEADDDGAGLTVIAGLVALSLLVGYAIRDR